MARLFVTSDNLAARVEVDDPSGEGVFTARCVGCGASRNLLDDLRARFNLNDAIEEAGQHADQCTRCADPDCRTDGRHDAGHRCRKD